MMLSSDYGFGKCPKCSKVKFSLAWVVWLVPSSALIARTLNYSIKLHGMTPCKVLATSCQVSEKYLSLWLKTDFVFQKAGSQNCLPTHP